MPTLSGFHQLAACLLLTAAVAPVMAGEEVDQTLAAPMDAVVSIENTRGEVEIVGWDQAQVSVAGELDDLADRLVFTVDGRDVIIRVEMPREDLNWGDGSDLTIKLPMNARVKFSGVSSDVTAEAVHGGLQLRTVSGDIEASDVGEQVMLNSVSGDIDVKDARGRLNITTISGDLGFTTDASVVQFETVSGDVGGRLQAFDRLTGRTVSGDVEVSGHLNSRGDIDLSSVSGDITLGLQPSVGAKLRVAGGPGSDIDNEMNATAPESSKYSLRQSLDTELGDGSGTISIRTVSADVNLEQEG